MTYCSILGIVGPTHEFTTQFRSALGSLHSRLHTSNFYISMNQSWYHNCNVNYESEEEANIFCQSFHGFNYRPICYERGFYTHSGQLGNQMHSRSDCFVKRIYGQDIDHTNCNNRKCKIWETDLDFQGLYNIVCAGRKKFKQRGVMTIKLTKNCPYLISNVYIKETESVYWPFLHFITM